MLKHHMTHYMALQEGPWIRGFGGVTVRQVRKQRNTRESQSRVHDKGGSDRASEKAT